MSTFFQFTWRSNVLQKVYNEVTIAQPFSNFFQPITVPPFPWLTGQYIAAEQAILNVLPRGFTQAIYTKFIMIQLNPLTAPVGLITGHLFRKWCPVGPSYILTATSA